jgi:uncharacterized protein (DUF2236 family)
MQSTSPALRPSIARQVNGERLTLFAWSRAILMQLAHPLVAAGVAAHSTFRDGGLNSAVRLHHTVHAMLALTFGCEADRERALEGIRTIHRRVNGRLSADVGRYRAGTAYSAEDPELVLWVHVTLLDSIPLVYEQLVAPLSIDDRDRYCDEAAGVAIALGAEPDAVPRNQAAVTRYIETMVGSGAVVVGGEAQALANAVLRPPLRALTGPAAALNRLLTISWLSPQLRSQYGFGWTERDARRAERACRWLHRGRQVMPAFLTRWRDSRK